MNRRLLQNLAATKTRKSFVLLLSVVIFAITAQATPLTHFVPNATGGFDAFIFPELLNGTQSLQGGIFTLPQTVNPGFVIILNSPTARQTDTSTWLDVIRFFDNGSGVVNSVQLLRGGPSQANYFPTLRTVNRASSAFVIVGTDSTGMFTTFTQYSVTAGVTRNYHFYTGAFPIPIPDEGSTFLLLGVAVAALLGVARKLRPA